METDGSGEDDDSDLDTDPDWQSGNTPGWLKPKTKRRRTDLFKQKSVSASSCL
ncbi:hypothetical protein DPMN_107101 [Dreissena polymorpha]|uniref:Uncharacterized protein n=1 Tax=Dreissena polymorpha TaxID=45954 RepID=A0A9D4K6B4_DREPO|nr:hypothetical protein DPMN_107101 [Dreissena polymorpha]